MQITKEPLTILTIADADSLVSIVNHIHLSYEVVKMEMFQRRIVGLEKTFLNNVVGCEPDVKRRELGFAYPPASSREVICPAPRRASRSPQMVESLNRLCCKPRSDLPASGDPSSEILNIILTKDNPEDDLVGANNNQNGFFCGSPPMRANNPLIHDVQFVQQTSTGASPLGNSQGGKAAPARVVDRAAYCGASSFGSKPIVRIEGFACRSSKSHCVVPALA